MARENRCGVHVNDGRDGRGSSDTAVFELHPRNQLLSSICMAMHTKTGEIKVHRAPGRMRATVITESEA